MKGLPEDRAVQFARYIIEAGATVRETAKEFHISKSTVHKDIQERLPLLNYPLYREVRVVLAAFLAIVTNLKQTKKWHPIVFLGFSAVVGIVIHFAGV